MTFEADLFLVIKGAAPQLVNASGMGRIYEDFAPVSTPRPYCTYQFIGGPIINPVDNSSPGVRLPDVQVNIWADTRAQAKALIHAIETGMRGATAFHAHPVGEAVSDFDADIPVFGSLQTFACRHTT